MAGDRGRDAAAGLEGTACARGAGRPAGAGICCRVRRSLPTGETSTMDAPAYGWRNLKRRSGVAVPGHACRRPSRPASLCRDGSPIGVLALDGLVDEGRVQGMTSLGPRRRGSTLANDGPMIDFGVLRPEDGLLQGVVATLPHADRWDRMIAIGRNSIIQRGAVNPGCPWRSSASASGSPRRLPDLVSLWAVYSTLAPGTEPGASLLVTLRGTRYVSAGQALLAHQPARKRTDRRPLHDDRERNHDVGHGEDRLGRNPRRPQELIA